MWYVDLLILLTKLLNFPLGFFGRLGINAIPRRNKNAEYGKIIK